MQLLFICPRGCDFDNGGTKFARPRRRYATVLKEIHREINVITCRNLNVILPHLGHSKKENCERKIIFSDETRSVYNLEEKKFSKEKKRNFFYSNPRIKFRNIIFVGPKFMSVLP